jgi:tetratricopeptide (TPR) repeat protein
MLQKKKKLSRKEIKEDKLVSFFYKSQSFFEENKNRMLTYGLVLVAVIFAIYYYLNQKKESNLDAGNQLSKVMKIYDSGSFLEAIEGIQGGDVIGLKAIVEKYGGTENGETAKIYLANAYSYLGNYDEAIKYYEDYGGSLDYMKAASLSGKAGFYSNKGEYKKAADLYKEAASVAPSNGENPDYLLNSGINYFNAGNYDEAKIVFDRLKENFQSSSSTREADKYIAMLKR